MSRFTSAYSLLIARVSEVNLLVKRARALEKKSPILNSKEINSLCRSSIVLLSSHIEGYVKDLGELALDRIYVKSVDRAKISPRFFYAISRGHFDDLKDTSDPSKIAEKVFKFLNEDLEYWDKSGPFSSALPVDKFLHGFASPSLDKISTFFSRFGYADYKSDLKRHLAADFFSISNMIGNIVSTRNNIAHGDSTAAGTPADIEGMVEFALKFCRATDDAFASWMTIAMCSIR